MPSSVGVSWLEVVTFTVIKAPGSTVVEPLSSKSRRGSAIPERPAKCWLLWLHVCIITTLKVYKLMQCTNAKQSLYNMKRERPPLWQNIYVQGTKDRGRSHDYKECQYCALCQQSIANTKMAFFNLADKQAPWCH